MPLDLRLDLTAIDPQAQLADLDRVDAEENLYTFFQGAWPYIDPAPWMDGWCMQAIAEHFLFVERHDHDADGLHRVAHQSITTKAERESATSALPMRP